MGGARKPETAEIQVLIVEDSNVDLEITRRQLRSTQGLERYTITHADCVDRALVLIEQNHFDVALVDQNLGFENGFGFLEGVGGWS